MTPEQERARSIAVIRRQLAWCGHPVDHLTDEEIEEGVMRSAKALASTGITVDQAAEGLRALATASSG